MKHFVLNTADTNAMMKEHRRRHDALLSMLMIMQIGYALKVGYFGKKAVLINYFKIDFAKITMCSDKMHSNSCCGYQ